MGKGGEKMSKKNNIRADWKANDIEGFNVDENGGDYKAVGFYSNDIKLLELRVSGTAIATKECGLDQEYIYEWLWKTGSQHIDKIDKPLIITLSSYDVNNGRLASNWKDLYRRARRMNKK